MIFNDIFELEKLIRKYEREGKTVLMTNGCFDIIHAGHITLLENAKKHCDVLIVAINSDKSVRELKGENRPFNNEGHRAYVLSMIKGVDYVYIFDELTFERTLEILKPKKYAKGQDYSLDKINQNERKIIESYGGEIIIIQHPVKITTTDILKKMDERK